MFEIRKISGALETYSPGIIRRLREVPGISPTSQVEPSTVTNHATVTRVADSPYQQRQPQERKRALAARDIMRSPVLCVDLETTMSEINRIMTNKRYRHLPVIDKKKQPRGMISDRDVLRFNLKMLQKDFQGDLNPVSEVMTKEVLIAAPDAEIREIVRVMFEEKIVAIPITGSAGEVIGIITRSDILRALLDRGPIELWV